MRIDNVHMIEYCMNTHGVCRRRFGFWNHVAAVVAAIRLVPNRDYHHAMVLLFDAQGPTCSSLRTTTFDVKERQKRRRLRIRVSKRF